MRRLIVLTLVLGCSLVLGCKSHSNQAEADRAAARKAKGQSAGDAAATTANQARGNSSAGNSSTVYQRGGTRRVEDTPSDDEENPKDHLEGGDPTIFHPPVHAGKAHEKIVETQASTPTPTPNRPIDRPLDPSGKPIIYSTPGG